MLQYILQEKKLSDAEYPGRNSQWKIPEEQVIGSCSLTPEGRHLNLGRLRGFFPEGHSPLGIRASTSVPAGNISIPTCIPT